MRFSGCGSEIEGRECNHVFLLYISFANFHVPSIKIMFSGCVGKLEIESEVG